MLFGFSSAAGVLVERGEEDLAVGVQRVEFDSAKHFLESRLVFALNAEEDAVPLVGHGIVGIERESLLDLGLSSFPIVVDREHGVGEVDVGFRKRRVKLDGTLGGGAGFGISAARLEEAEIDAAFVDMSESGERLRTVRIIDDSLFKRSNDAIETFGSMNAGFGQATKIGIESMVVHGLVRRRGIA